VFGVGTSCVFILVLQPIESYSRGGSFAVDVRLRDAWGRWAFLAIGFDRSCNIYGRLAGTV